MGAERAKGAGEAIGLSRPRRTPGAHQPAAPALFAAFFRSSALRMCLRTRTVFGVTSTSSSSAIHSRALSSVSGAAP